MIIGVSFCAERDRAFYVIFRYWDVENQRLIDTDGLSEAKSLMQTLVGKSLIMQNAGFDCEKVVDNFGIDLMPSLFHDTLVSGHLLDENRRNGLKERGAEMFGEDALEEKKAMIRSITSRGGSVTKANYELYKGDPAIIAKYGAKDALLTMKLFDEDVQALHTAKLDKFFYDEESMPLLRGPTYHMNTTGLKVDLEALAKLRSELETECALARDFFTREMAPLVKDKYAGTSKRTTFNVNSNEQLAWLLFDKLEEPFNTLTDSGKGVCKFLDLPLPYTIGAKRDFIEACIEAKGQVWRPAGTYNPKTKKTSKKDAKIESPFKYMSTGKVTLKKFSERYLWVAKLLEFKKAEKILTTYVIGIQNRVRYGVIRPEFKQIGTTSGRYSSKNPNFQNLPRDDKRVKACIIARPGKVFVGADYSQLEPRTFASLSGDKSLKECFAAGFDFYSVVGLPVFKVGSDCSLVKGAPNFWREVNKKEGAHSKIISLAIPYGRTGRQLAVEMGIEVDEAQEIIDSYWSSYPEVHAWQTRTHAEAKKTGVVTSMFGRPRRIPRAMDIVAVYGRTPHSELPYEARTLLNLAVNHTVQSAAASIVNRAAIAFLLKCQELGKTDPRWLEVRLVMQVHDELIGEAPKTIAEEVAKILQYAMENTVDLPGVKLSAEPRIANNIAELK